MSVTGPAQSAVDWVNPVNWGPWGPLAGALGWGPEGHVGGRRRRHAGDHLRGGASPDFAGKTLRGTGRGAARRVRSSVRRRIDLRRSHGLTRPEWRVTSTAVSTVADAGDLASSRTTTEAATCPKEGSDGVLEVPGARLRARLSTLSSVATATSTAAEKSSGEMEVAATGIYGQR